MGRRKPAAKPQPPRDDDELEFRGPFPANRVTPALAKLLRDLDKRLAQEDADDRAPRYQPSAERRWIDPMREWRRLVSRQARVFCRILRRRQKQKAA